MLSGENTSFSSATAKSNPYHCKHFLRVHSKNNDPADVQTQIWKAAFEPSPGSSTGYTNIVATCGGYSVCFIDVCTGRVMKKFNSENLKEIFYDVAWGCYENENILAAGGSCKCIYLISLSGSRVLSCQFPTGSMKSKAAVNCLMFHPREKDVLFCGISTGEILISRIEFTGNNPLQTIHNIQCNANGELIQMAFSSICNTLLVATANGLQAWVLDSEFKTDSRDGYVLELPSVPNCTQPINPFFDTVITLNPKLPLVASKRALEGHIAIWDLNDALTNRDEKSKKIKVNKGCFLKWSPSDNYYMSLGWNNTRNMLACGDDKGCIWMYNLNLSSISGNFSDTPLKESFIIQWPENLQDQHVAKKRKLCIETYDIVLAKVAMSGPYIVTVTNNNLVCIWKSRDFAD